MIAFTLFVLLVASYTDIKKGIIPNWLIYPSFLIACIYRIYMAEYMILLLAAGIILTFLVVFMFTDGIGGGDIKLFALLALTVDFQTPFIMVLSFLLAIVYGYLFNKKEIRLAPFITASFLIIQLI